ncbi:MAG: RICIN domain-containing protein [Bacteroidales bacterium]|nr:RICIN domain-containing protein [Bacteroidales bacterium]
MSIRINMKISRVLQGIAALAVLVLMSFVPSDGSSSGVIESGLDKLKYTISGGRLKTAGEPNYSRNMGKLNTTQSFVYDVSPGSTISVMGKNGGPSVEDGGNYSLRATIAFKDEKRNLIGEIETVRTKNESIAISRTMPTGAMHAEVNLYFSREFNNITAIYSFHVPENEEEIKSEWFGPKEVPVSTQCHVMDSKIRFNEYYGEVKIRCDYEEDDSYEFVDRETVIYENARIKTEEDSGAILGLDDLSTYVIKPESILIIRTTEDTRSKFEVFLGNAVINIKKFARGRSIVFEMSQCVAGINGTIVAFEETGLESTVWLFAGKVTVTNKKTGKEVVLEPGQKAYSRGTGTKVYPFKIEEMAQKFDIPMSEIENHYSNGPAAEKKPVKTEPVRTPVTTHSESAGLPDGVYSIRYASSPDYAMSIYQGKAMNATPVRLSTWKGANAQRWKVENAGNGNVYIRSMANNNVVLGAESLSNQSEICVYKYTGDKSQQWVADNLGGGLFLLKPAANTSFSLDLYDGWAVDNGILQLYKTNDGESQQWLLEKE